MFPRKENGDFPMATPPTSPQVEKYKLAFLIKSYQICGGEFAHFLVKYYHFLLQKFSPSVTSSPSILSATALVKTQVKNLCVVAINEAKFLRLVTINIFDNKPFQPLPPHLTPTTPAKNPSNTKV